METSQTIACKCGHFCICISANSTYGEYGELIIEIKIIQKFLGINWTQQIISIIHTSAPSYGNMGIMRWGMKEWGKRWITNCIILIYEIKTIHSDLNDISRFPSNIQFRWESNSLKIGSLARRVSTHRAMDKLVLSKMPKQNYKIIKIHYPYSWHFF